MKRRYSIPKLTEMQKSYIAGCIDSDGSMGIYKITYHEKVFYKPTICLTTVYPKYASYLANLLGHKYSRNKNTKLCMVQITARKNIHDLLKAVLPHLVLKKPQAEVLFKWSKEELSHIEATAQMKVLKKYEDFR